MTRMLFVLSLAAAVSSPWQSAPEEFAAAQLQLDSGHINRAVDLAERYTYHHPRDAAGFLLLGNAYAARMPAGRFQALAAYQEARRLLPTNAEPPYRMARMGIILGGDDGERIASEGLRRVLEIDPLYRDAWDLWLTLYRDAGDRRQILARLSKFSSDPVIRLRIAQLQIENGDYAAASGMLDSALAADSGSGTLLALRAQAALESGDTTGGMLLYAHALDRAASDSLNVLWQQVIGIASPDEVRAWAAGIPREQRAGWLRSFWATRDPDLFANTNHRIGEHFARLRYARQHYPLLHPLVSYHRSSLSRSLNLEPSGGEREFNTRCEVFQAQLPTTAGAIQAPGARIGGLNFSMDPLWYLSEDEKQVVHDAWVRHRSGIPPAVQQAIVSAGGFAFAPTIYFSLGFDLRNVDSTAGRIGYNLATGLDDRGIMYLRFGEPALRLLGGDNTLDPQCNSIDVERWRYADGTEVRFDRPSAFSRGTRTMPEMVFRPMTQRQFDGMKSGLTSDASSIGALLSFGTWTAQFKGDSSTDLVVFANAGDLAAALVSDTGTMLNSLGTDGMATIEASPGRYALLTQVRQDTALGRARSGLVIRRFTRSSMSDLLLARTWRGDATRREMIARANRSLTFAAGDTVRSYAEIYVEPGAAQVVVRYSLLKADHPEQSFSFERSGQASSGVLRETLDILPERIPSGRYILRLEASLPDGRPVGRSEIQLLVR